MQHSSPALSSPSTGFFGPRASPLFTQAVDQPDPISGDGSASSSTTVAFSSSNDGGQQAPPKQLAQAMDGLSHALRLIADIRVGSESLLHALESAVSAKSTHAPSSSASQASASVTRAADAVSASLDALRATGKRLEALGVMNGAQQRFEERHPWGLQVPLICSDGATVAYSWKRQIAGQAAASAVERTRLAMKAFTDQKKRYFPKFGEPHEEEDIVGVNEKRAKVSSTEDDISSQKFSLLHVLKHWQGVEGSGMVISEFNRLEWAKHSSAYTLKKRSLNVMSAISGSSDTVSRPSLDASSVKNVAILEVSVPAVFKAVISLFPSGSVMPDAVSVVSSDEVCINAHLGTTSAQAVFQRVSECATSALYTFRQASSSSRASPLQLLLHWLYTYRSLFSKPCSRCKRFLALDGPSDSLLPPLVRPAQQILRIFASSASVKLEDLNDEKLVAYHMSCISKEDLL